MCDSTLKFEMIGINLPVNLNLNFQSKFSVNLNLLQVCRLDGSYCLAAAAPRLRLPVSSRKYVPCKLSDAKGQLPQASS